MESNLLNRKYIKNGELTISKAEWSALNRWHSQDELIDLISQLISQLPLPLRRISERDAVDAFQKLQNLDTRNLFKKVDGETYIDIHKAGTDSSNYFHQLNRYKASSVNSPSPFRMWTTEKLRRNWLKVLWSMKYEEVNPLILRQALSLRGYLASQFRPSAAKAMFDLLESKTVLDFSAGWGDRLAGFAAATRTKSYVGIDPNESLFEGYERQVKLYGSGKKFELINAAAEDVDFGIRRFDTIFTSPPYFRQERYTRQANQSWMRYKTLEQWLDGFLWVVLDKATAALKKNGFLALNIADVYSERKVNEIVKPTAKFMEDCGLKLVGTIGYRIHSRPQTSEKSLVKMEGIYLWKKG